MASDVTIGGEVMYKWWTDADSEYLGDTDAELLVTAVVDDYNTAKLDWEAVNDADTLQIDESYFTTEWGKYLGTEDMGVTITTYWGYNEWMNAQYGEVTEYGDEEAFDFDDEAWSANIDVGIMDVVHVEYAISPNPAGVANSLVGVYGGMDPIHVEVYYSREEALYEDGEIGVAVNFAMDIMPGMFGLEVGASFVYDLDEDVEAADDYATPPKYALGVGIATDIMDGTAYVDLGFYGTDENIFSVAFAAVGANYEGMVGVDLGVGLTLNDDIWDEVLDEIDVYVWTKIGAAKFGVGYLLHADQTGNPLAVAFFDPNGNFFGGLNCPDADLCNPATVENGVIYFSGELDF
jgi:hypothetical protein